MKLRKLFKMRVWIPICVIAVLLATVVPVSAQSAEPVTPQVAAGHRHTVGLKADGTVAAVGDNYWGQCNVDAANGFTGITQVAAGNNHTVGLTSEGKVVAVGDNRDGQCSGVAGWEGITQVAAGSAHTVGLTSEGKVVAVGQNYFGQCSGVADWEDFTITQVAAGA
jgi:alpha-tubulin suppressor-like RCC1 family protein